MTSAVRRILRWSRDHRVLVAAALAVALIASLAGIRRLAFDTDVLSLLPRDGRVIPSFRTFLADFGSLDQLYVVFEAPQGRSIADYDDEIDAWIAALRQAPEITRVDSGRVDASRDFEWLADRQLLLLRDDGLKTAIGRFRGAGMREAVAARRELLSVPSPEVAQLVRRDPLGLFDLLREQLGGAQAGVNIGVTEGGYVTADGRSRLVIAQPARPPYDADFSHALLARLDAIRASVAASRAPADPSDEALPPLDVQFAGGHRIAVETESVVRRESISNTVGSLALILPLLYFVFRSPWLVGVGSLPSGLSLALVLGALGFAGATLSAAATASAAMLFGLGVDGVVLLYVAYAHALEEGASPGEAIVRLDGASFSMLLGMWTTAATFYGLLFVDFPSLEQLGRLIGHSMLACGVLTLLMVPAFLPLTKPRWPRRSLRMPGLARWVERRRGLVLASALVVTIVLGFAATRVRINPTLDRLKSVTPAAQLEEDLAKRFGLPRDVYVMLDEGPDLDVLLSKNEQLAARLSAQAPQVPVQAASSLLPSAGMQAHRIGVLESAGLSGAGVATELHAAATEAGFRADSFDPFVQHLPELLDQSHRLTFDGYREHGLADLIGRFVSRQDRRWVIASYAFPRTAADAAVVQRMIDETNAGTLTGLALVNRELSDRFLPQFLRGLTIGSLIVVFIVAAAFRNWWASLLSLLPTAIGLVWAAGLLAIIGAELDLFALFAVVTFVGIGVDYGIHMVQRYRETGRASQAIEELAPVILVAAAITVLGYGTLITSSYPPLRSIGLVSAVSVAALAVASVLVLPALLTRRASQR